MDYTNYHRVRRPAFGGFVVMLVDGIMSDGELEGSSHGFLLRIIPGFISCSDLVLVVGFVLPRSFLTLV